jgi:hypothetical protein
MKKEIIIYMHRSKEENYDLSDELGLSDEASANFKWCCMEVAVRVEVDLETGETKILGLKE